MDMAYKRWIAYFDLVDQGIERGNVGFVKWEQYDECHILSVFVNGLAGSYTGEVKVYLDGLYSIGTLAVKNGKAEGTYLLSKGEKNWQEMIRAIWIPIEDKKELRAEFESFSLEKIWKEKQDNIEKKTVLQEEKHNEAIEKVALQGERQIDAVEKVTLQEEKLIDSIEKVALKGEKQNEEFNMGEATNTVGEELEKTFEELKADISSIKMQADTYNEIELEEKNNPNNQWENRKEKTLWEQLEENRELTYPFGNGVGCYRIFPKDIEFLDRSCRGLGNNQFLLHGYYNYRHLIICRKENSNNEFWLGVPGIYHEREKLAARMFGF